jgi:hypothetical protein
LLTPEATIMADNPHRISLLAAWEPPLDPARPVWVRRFGRPAGLGDQGRGAHPGAGPRVVLVVAGDAVAVVLNGIPLAVEPPASQEHEPPASQRHDITRLIAARNELRLTSAVVERVVGNPARHGRIDLPEAVGRVWLEIVADGATGSA